MLFEVPTVPEEEPEAPAPPVPAPPAPTMSTEQAVALYRARHIASATLLQRNPPGFPCDPRDAEKRDAAALACEAIPPATIAAAWAAWREEHHCSALESCPLGPRPRGGRR